MAHQNSREAYRETAELRAKRLVVIYAKALYLARPLTDRQLMKALGFDDMNKVRPRITKLIKLGYLAEAGKIRCEDTNQTVRLSQARTLEQRDTWAKGRVFKDEPFAI